MTVHRRFTTISILIHVKIKFIFNTTSYGKDTFISFLQIFKAQRRGFWNHVRAFLVIVGGFRLWELFWLSSDYFMNHSFDININVNMSCLIWCRSEFNISWLWVKLIQLRFEPHYWPSIIKVVEINFDQTIVCLKFWFWVIIIFIFPNLCMTFHMLISKGKFKILIA